MESTKFESKCWRYYLALEDNFRKIERYITFERENESCFSIEFLKQYQTICSEIDVVCKMYCEFLNSEGKRKNILHYANVILSNKTDFTHSEISLKENSSYILRPWDEWTCNHSNFEDGSDPNNKPLKWWNLYNKVKHQRLDIDSNGVPYYKSATLGNTINALSALFVLEMNFYRDLAINEGRHNVTIPNSASKLFTYNDWENHIINVGNGLILDIIG